ncbi:hypothetical protein NKH80_01750 [Mesorhizobium sp. M0904]|uniref:hypothetical protein n=1 Tax=unclassified Mesorhizobium TaxID=325217 RepID=UPI0033389EA0
MTKRNKEDYQSVSKAVRKLIRSEDNRRHMHKLLRLEVEPELPPTLASLLAAIDRAKQGPTEEGA